MKLLAPLIISTLVLAGCAGSHERVAVADAIAAGDSCRTVIVGTSGDVACGSAEQWAEFDRRAALINAGVTCRWARTANELCLTEEQWEVYARRTQNYADAQRMGVEQAANAAQIGFARDQGAQFQAAFDAAQVRMQASVQ